MRLLSRIGVVALGTASIIVVAQSTAVAQSKEVRGQVLAVSDSSLTIQAGERSEFDFLIDKDTLLEAKGAGTEDAPGQSCRQGERRNNADRLRKDGQCCARQLQGGCRQESSAQRPVDLFGGFGHRRSRKERRSHQERTRQGEVNQRCEADTRPGWP